MESYMPNPPWRDRINDSFDLLGLLVVRLTLLALEIIGAYTLIRGHLFEAIQTSPRPPMRLWRQSRLATTKRPERPQSENGLPL
jgi:hypothetical protein